MSQQEAASRRHPANAARCLSRSEGATLKDCSLARTGPHAGLRQQMPLQSIYCLMLSPLPVEWSAHTAPGAPVVQLHASSRATECQSHHCLACCSLAFLKCKA